MKPAPFSYVRAGSVDEAVSALAAGAGDAKLIAGGQSLVPMLNFRLIDTAVFVDINGIDSLAGVNVTDDGGLRIGSLARHHAIETSNVVRDRVPVLSAAMQHVAHLAIRNRGTIGGSLAHADPAAELPALSVLLDAQIATKSPLGSRTIPASDLFVAPLTTVLEAEEIITEIKIPGLPRAAGWGFEEFSQRRGDFAIAGAAAIVTTESKKVTTARIALFGVHDVPFRIPAAEEALILDGVDAAASAVRKTVNPTTDIQGSAEYRRHLSDVLTRRVLTKAIARAGG